MHTLIFTLNPDSLSRLHDAILCLAKFNEAVSLEARLDQVQYPIMCDSFVD